MKDDFYVACNIFLIYYFVYQWGEERPRREQWLKNFIQLLIPTWDDEWEDMWHLTHNSLLKEISDRISEYMQQWLDSTAGEVFVAELRKQQYLPLSNWKWLITRAAGRVKPTLGKESLSEYYSEHTKKTYPGMLLVVEDIRRIFFRLTALSRVITVRVGFPLNPKLKSQRKA